MMKIQKGFTLIEVVLVLVIAGILGGTGWYVYSSNNKTQDAYSNADSVNASSVSYKKKTTTAKDPTADWLAYSSKEGQFSLKYPKTWVTATHPELCNTGMLLLGADKNSVGVCASDFVGQVSISSVAGDTSKTSEISSGYTTIENSDVTVDGVIGKKQSITSEVKLTADNVQVVNYVFYTNGHTYTATYSKIDTAPDVLSDFNLIVTKTLKFSAS